ncbi:sensor histidine kinase [Proteiniborus sp. DW1]|uniref:sensor histidine kinase n=1 Tax=Proteiniborus sp. DW1 TaxID=1889883 RepID=UPI00092E150D|nr:sensor histidine kinase [Proteiniborus sp. DW1]SCG84017.1 sensor histidine kinase [Proteiniborus sp. DW1]
MNKLLKFNGFIAITIRILIALDTIYRCRNNIKELIVYLACFLIILANDYLRIYNLYKDYKKYYISISISMLLSWFLTISLNGYSDIYLFIILYELILYNQGRIANLLTIFEILFLIFLSFFRSITSIEEIFNIKYWKDNFIEIFWFIIYISFYSISLLSYKALRKEKRRVEELNKELEQSYNKLEEQSKRIEELVITEERNRIAGDIHDNLGHTLVALNMNLDVAENLIDKDLEKTKEILRRSKNLAKDSLNDLRKAVYALKEENLGGFTESIKRIVDNVESTGNIKVNLSIDKKANELLLKYKDIICISIKEAITNSIKHGKASEVNIDIKVSARNAYIEIKDNGVGCDTLIKGNGLLGIENRISNIGGKVNYNNKEEKGFAIGVELSL